MTKDSVTIAFDDEVRFILGRSCFVVVEEAEMLRSRGQQIPYRAEDQQAAAIFWLLQMYQEYGAEWRQAARREIQAWRDGQETLARSSRAKSNGSFSDPPHTDEGGCQIG